MIYSPGEGGVENFNNIQRLLSVRWIDFLWIPV